MVTRRRKPAGEAARPPSEQPAPQRVYLPPKDPWIPAEYDVAEVMAVKALAEARATPEQQRIAFRWILEAAANYHDIDFRPGGLDGERASAFNSGRRFVGAQIMKLRHLNPAMITRRSE